MYLLDAGGLSIPGNLVFPVDESTPVGTYKFTEIDVKNLKVEGSVDGINWNQVPGELFLPYWRPNHHRNVDLR